MRKKLVDATLIFVPGKFFSVEDHHYTKAEVYALERSSMGS